jgi:GNAT superfamily N-acetyltransferase
MDAAAYLARDTLRDGTCVEIRAVRPADAGGLRQSLARMSEESIVRRFFAPRSGLSEEEVARFMDVDFVGQAALVASVADADGERIVGGARYVLLSPGVAEMACAVEDSHQGRGLGTLLVRHLGVLARAAGIREVRADVLAENQPMLRLLRGSGLPLAQERESGAVHLTLQLEPRSAP